MYQRMLLASLLLTVIALANCVVHPKPTPTYSPDFTFPSEATPSRKLPIWDWPLLSDYVGNGPQRVRRQAPLPTSDNEQFHRCNTYEEHGAYSHPRLLLTWYSTGKPDDPVQYLRTILADDLDLAELVFSLRRVQLQSHKLLFEMSSNLDAYEVLLNYCQLFTSIMEYRHQGYDESALSFEIQLTDRNFND